MNIARPALLPAAHTDEPVPSVLVAGVADPEMRTSRNVAGLVRQAGFQ